MQLSCACKRWERRCFGRCFLAIRMPICSFVHTRYHTMLHKAICNLLFFFILAWCANGLLWTKASDLFLRSYRQDIWCEKWAAKNEPKNKLDTRDFAYCTADEISPRPQMIRFIARRRKFEKIKEVSKQASAPYRSIQLKWRQGSNSAISEWNSSFQLLQTPSEQTLPI